MISHLVLVLNFVFDKTEVVYVLPIITPWGNGRYGHVDEPYADERIKLLTDAYRPISIEAPSLAEGVRGYHHRAKLVDLTQRKKMLLRVFSLAGRSTLH